MKVARIAGGLLLGAFLLLLANASVLSPMVVSYIDPRSASGVLTALLAAAIGAAAGGFAVSMAGPAAREVPLILAGATGILGLSIVMEHGADFSLFLVTFVQAPSCALGGELRRRALPRKPLSPPT